MNIIYKLASSFFDKRVVIVYDTENIMWKWKSAEARIFSKHIFMCKTVCPLNEWVIFLLLLAIFRIFTVVFTYISHFVKWSLWVNELSLNMWLACFFLYEQGSWFGYENREMIVHKSIKSVYSVFKSLLMTDIRKIQLETTQKDHLKFFKPMLGDFYSV